MPGLSIVDARQRHHPALVHHHTPTGETLLLHAAKTRRCRRARCHAAPPSRTPPAATGPIPCACSSSNRAPKRPRRRLQEGYDTCSAAAAQSKEILGFHPGMGSGWRAGTSTAPARRRTATLVVATLGMNESSRVSSSPMAPLPALANAPRPTTSIVCHQVQQEKACNAEEIHRQLTAHAVKMPSIHPPRTSPTEGAVAMPNGAAAPGPGSSTMAGVERSATSDEIRHHAADAIAQARHRPIPPPPGACTLSGVPHPWIWAPVHHREPAASGIRHTVGRAAPRGSGRPRRRGSGGGRRDPPPPSHARALPGADHRQRRRRRRALEGY